MLRTSSVTEVYLICIKSSTSGSCLYRRTVMKFFLLVNSDIYLRRRQCTIKLGMYVEAVSWARLMTMSDTQMDINLVFEFSSFIFLQSDFTYKQSLRVWSTRKFQPQLARLREEELYTCLPKSFYSKWNANGLVHDLYSDRHVHFLKLYPLPDQWLNS